MAKQKSDLSRAFSEDGAIKTHVGGQALIEGIMMQGPEKRCIVVRRPDGTTECTVEAIPPKKKIWTVPFLRGLAGFIGSRSYGVKALMHSAEVAGDDEMADEEPTKFDLWLEKMGLSENGRLTKRAGDPTIFLQKGGRG